MSIMHFQSTVAASRKLAGLGLSTVSLSGSGNSFIGSAFAALYLNRDGTLGTDESPGATSWRANEWVVSADRTATVGDDFECRLDWTGNTPAGSAINTWLTISTQRWWSLTQATPGSLSGSGTLRIRPVGGGTETTASVSILASYT
jgi:hypothetical protein